jgi:hypothetical protein
LLSSREGFGLAATIMLLVIFAVLGLVGISLAHNEQRAQIRTSARWTAFYAAETGLAEALSNWNLPSGVIPAGHTWVLVKGTVSHGASYWAEATRLDDGTSVHPLYSIRSEGRAGDGTVQRVGLLVSGIAIEIPVKSALAVTDSATTTGTSTITGFDTIPPAWNGEYCTTADKDVVGLLMADTTKLDVSGATEVLGYPALAQRPDTTGFYTFGGITFESLTEIADITLANGEVIDGWKPRPSYNADGSCNVSDIYNWGDPLNAGQPCSDWFPIIYARGDLTVQGEKEGQGLLLVEGNLTAKGQFEFYGPVIIKGSFNNEGGFVAYGGVRAHDALLTAGESWVVYSDCVVERALSHIKSKKVVLLKEHPWFQNR